VGFPPVMASAVEACLSELHRRGTERLAAVEAQQRESVALALAQLAGSAKQALRKHAIASLHPRANPRESPPRWSES
jgi:hypothetical protein